jgi:hypothetical protein
LENSEILEDVILSALAEIGEEADILEESIKKEREVPQIAHEKREEQKSITLEEFPPQQKRVEAKRQSEQTTFQKEIVHIPPQTPTLKETIPKQKPVLTENTPQQKPIQNIPINTQSAVVPVQKATISSDEKEFLQKIVERTKVLFEGLKSEEIKQSQKKLDITLKYLEYLNIQISERLEKMS